MGSKMRATIGEGGEGQLKIHQINCSISLGNTKAHLPSPPLIPYFGTLHWRINNFGFPYWIEMRFET
jgi:hypothetical protein